MPDDKKGDPDVRQDPVAAGWWRPTITRVGDLEVSTIRTFAGGEPASRPWWSPFSTADYADETPWPYETMVFKVGSSIGLYHEPHRSAKEATDAHNRIVSLCRENRLPVGHGVQGPFGNPSTTPDDWRTALARMEEKS